MGPAVGRSDVSTLGSAASTAAAGRPGFPGVLGRPITVAALPASPQQGAESWPPGQADWRRQALGSGEGALRLALQRDKSAGAPGASLPAQASLGRRHRSWVATSKVNGVHVKVNVRSPSFSIDVMSLSPAFSQTCLSFG